MSEDILLVLYISNYLYPSKTKTHLNQNKEYCAPLTSFDWNETDSSIIGTCSIDTTCTIWDINVSVLVKVRNVTTILTNEFESITVAH